MKESRVDGSCLCGATSFHIILPSSNCIHCHCSMCRRSHGAGYVTWVELPLAQLTIDSGENGLVTYDSSDHGNRRFCGTCGSTLFAFIEERPDHIAIPMANLHSSIDREPEAHVFFDSRVTWAAVDHSLPRLGGETGMEPIES